jgi:DNA (cytosine-5)-methyltransferase 1
MSQLTVIDLFCGAGGLSLGFERAGFRMLAAYDKWLPAVRTYRANFSHPVEEVDINENLDVPQAGVIAGGPPCQGFSSAGLRRPDDERNTLIAAFARLVATARPTAFVFENVEGFLTGSDGRYVVQLLAPLIDTGYRIHLRKVNAANYGVPQHRKRVIALGGLGWDPTFSPPTHSAYGAPGAHLATQLLPPTPTLREALVGLPSAREGTEEGGDEFAHSYSLLGADDLARAKFLRPGKRMRDLPEELWHKSYRRRAFRRVMDGTPTERRGGAPAGLRRLRGDEPSKAITGGALNEFLHPDEDRSLTVRECARLQTFPDEFRFACSRRDAIQLIGNAVPPLLATILARQLAEDLRSAVPRHTVGALLTFVPTLSSGASPVLARVVQMVKARFDLLDSPEQMTMRWV